MLQSSYKDVSNLTCEIYILSVEINLPVSHDKYGRIDPILMKSYFPLNDIVIAFLTISNMTFRILKGYQMNIYMPQMFSLSLIDELLKELRPIIDVSFLN